MKEWKACRVCGSTGITYHHIFYGTANRRLSEKYHLVIWVCDDCHKRMHKDKAFRQKYQAMAKRKFEREHPDLSFREIFGKEYV